MRQTHLLLAGTCAISLGIGYFAGGGNSGEKHRETGEKDSGGTPERHATKSGQTRGTSRGDHEILAGLLGGKPPQDLKGESLVRLIHELSKYDTAEDGLTRTRRNYQFQLLLSKLSSEQLEEAASASLGNSDSLRYGGLSSVITAMMEKNPKRALSWADEHQDIPTVESSILSGLATADPREAARRYQKSMMEGGMRSNVASDSRYAIGSSVARLGKDAFLDYVDSLPRQTQGIILATAIRDLPESDRLATLDEIHNRTKDAPPVSWTMKNIISNLAYSDPETAAAWIAKMEPSKEKAELEISQANRYGQSGNETAAREWVKRAISRMPGNEIELLTQNRLSLTSASDVLRVIDLMPENVEIRADDIKQLAQGFIYSDLGSIADIAGGLKDPQEQVKLLTEVMGDTGNPDFFSATMNANDFKILENRVAKLNLKGENLTAVMDLISKAKSGTTRNKQ